MGWGIACRRSVAPGRGNGMHSGAFEPLVIPSRIALSRNDAAGVLQTKLKDVAVVLSKGRRGARAVHGRSMSRYSLRWFRSAKGDGALRREADRHLHTCL